MIHIVVAVIIQDNKVLLQKRRDLHLWSYPGGKVEPDESYCQAIIRETFEETGLVVEVVQHVADFHQPQINQILHVMECKIVGGEIIKRSRETVDVKWFSTVALPCLRLPSTKRYLEIALKNLPDVQEETMLYPYWMVLANNIVFWLKSISV